MRRSLSLLTATILAAGALAAPSVRAQSAPPVPEVPAEPNVTDPTGDANYLNDQGNGQTVGDNETPADPSSVGDIKAAWFTTTAGEVSAHIQTEAPAPATAALWFRVHASNESGAGCLWFEAGTPGVGGGAEPVGDVWDSCADIETEAVVTLAEAEDGSGIITITSPRDAHPAFADNSVLGAPYASSRHWVGITAPQIDTTKRGTDYTVKAAGGGVEPEPEPKPDPKPSVPKKCKKLKGKARTKCIKNAKKVCKPYARPERAAELETVKVTDKATEEAPIELTIATGEGLGMGRGTFGAAVSHAYQNIQVDSKAAKAGLYMRVEFPEHNDYDLYLDRADGTTAAQAAGFGEGVEQLQDGDTSDGHTEIGAEQVSGVETADCGGYTADIVGATTEGGEVTVKLWLGDSTFVPAAPEGQ